MELDPRQRKTVEKHLPGGGLDKDLPDKPAPDPAPEPKPDTDND